MSFKENYHLRFRYTPKTVLNSLLWGLAVPVGIYFLIRSEHVRRFPRVPPPLTPLVAAVHPSFLAPTYTARAPAQKRVDRQNGREDTQYWPSTSKGH